MMIQNVDLVHAIPHAMLVIGPEQMVVGANNPMLHVLGTQPVGRHFITALRQPTLVQAVEQAIAQRKDVESQYLGRDGGADTTFTVHIRPSGDLTVLTFDDTTAAVAVGQLRRDFVANVSHELRTPLTAIMGFIETLRGAARHDPAAQNRFLDIMSHEASRMTRLIDDLLSLSRVEGQERIRPSAPVDLGDILRSTVANLAPVVTTAGATIAATGADTKAIVAGDANQLQQVFGNLIENAVKYGAKGGTVTVTMDAPTYHAELRQVGACVMIADNGEGIAAHHLPRLTERFYRVDTHRSRDIGGTGLGLAIVKHILSRHRGCLRLQSAVGVGTTCRVLLPVIDGAV